MRHGALPAAGRGDWTEAWVRIDSIEAAVLDLLALGPEVEVLHPPQLRTQMARAAGQIAALHRDLS
ncbi:MAG TPA: WYL domain-containing protein [Streptosporangiaceae bacterium]|nr:WYL domain-containing protein [Streptosporangiaceae bacterium]